MNKDSCRSAFFSLLFITMAFYVSLSPAKAQEATAPMSSPPALAKTAAPNQSLPADQSEVTILRDDYAGKYNTSTLQNLSKLYWRLGAFDMDDDVAVGNYLKIHDCKIYTEYLNDDLEWKEIVGTMKQHLKETKDTFPLNYQFLIQINLGRYDTELRGFPLVNRTGFTDAKRIEVGSVDEYRKICYDDTPIQDYPKNIVILLSKPFTFNFLKLDEHVAQAYILRKKAEYAKLSEEVRVKSYERTAYIRLRVNFSQYNGNLRGERNKVMSILYGHIDGYEVFEDVEQKRLMASFNLTDSTAGPEISTVSPAAPSVAEPAVEPPRTAPTSASSQQ